MVKKLDQEVQSTEKERQRDSNSPVPYKEKQIKVVPLRISHNTVSLYFSNISLLVKFHCHLKVNFGLHSAVQFYW